MAKLLPSLFFLLLLVSSMTTTLVLGSSPVVLEEQRSNYYSRPDPLRGFRLYEGGYDIRNKHYWASAAFKGVHGFAIAGIWMLGGLVLLVLSPIWKKKFGSCNLDFKSRYCNLLVVLAIVLFTLLAIVSSGLNLAACHSFRGGAKKLELTLLGAGRATCHAIHRVLRALKEIHKLLCPYNKSICTLLSSTTMDLRTKSRAIRGVMHKAGYLFDVILRIIYGVTMGIVCLNLVLVITAIVVLLLRWRPGLTMIIWICWILTTICWVLTGFHFFLHIYIEDTCSALEDFEQNPSNNSLNSILPCPNPTSANSIMVEIGFGIHSLINQLNKNITKLISTVGHEVGLSRELRRVCDPFNPPKYNYDASRCSSNIVSIGDMLDVLEREKPIILQGSFSMISAYAYSIQGFISAFSDLQKLIHCTFLKDAFNNALFQQCKPLRASIQLLWFSMISLSICMVALEVAWIAKVLEERGRCLSMKSMPPVQA